MFFMGTSFNPQSKEGCHDGLCATVPSAQLAVLSYRMRALPSFVRCRTDGNTAMAHVSLREGFFMTDHVVLDAARANLDHALRAEGEALASACDAAKSNGAASAEAVNALRSAQLAHARSNAALGQVRALNAQSERVDGAPQGPAGASLDRADTE